MSAPVPMTLLQVKYIEQGETVYKVLVPKSFEDSDGESIVPSDDPRGINPIICQVQNATDFKSLCSTENAAEPCLTTFVDLSSEYKTVKSLVKLKVRSDREGNKEVIPIKNKKSESNPVCIDLTEPAVPNETDQHIFKEPLPVSNAKNVKVTKKFQDTISNPSVITQPVLNTSKDQPIKPYPQVNPTSSIELPNNILGQLLVGTLITSKPLPFQNQAFSNQTVAISPSCQPPVSTTKDKRLLNSTQFFNQLAKEKHRLHPQREKSNQVVTKKLNFGTTSHSLHSVLVKGNNQGTVKSQSTQHATPPPNSQLTFSKRVAVNSSTINETPAGQSRQAIHTVNQRVVNTPTPLPASRQYLLSQKMKQSNHTMENLRTPLHYTKILASPSPTVVFPKQMRPAIKAETHTVLHHQVLGKSAQQHVDKIRNMQNSIPTSPVTPSVSGLEWSENNAVAESTGENASTQEMDEPLLTIGEVWSMTGEEENNRFWESEQSALETEVEKATNSILIHSEVDTQVPTEVREDKMNSIHSNDKAIPPKPGLIKIPLGNRKHETFSQNDIMNREETPLNNNCNGLITGHSRSMDNSQKASLDTSVNIIPSSKPWRIKNQTPAFTSSVLSRNNNNNPEKRGCPEKLSSSQKVPCYLQSQSPKSNTPQTNLPSKSDIIVFTVKKSGIVTKSFYNEKDYGIAGIESRQPVPVTSQHTGLEKNMVLARFNERNCLRNSTMLNLEKELMNMAKSKPIPTETDSTAGKAIKKELILSDANHRNVFENNREASVSMDSRGNYSVCGVLSQPHNRTASVNLTSGPVLASQGNSPQLSSPVHSLQRKSTAICGETQLTKPESKYFGNYTVVTTENRKEKQHTDNTKTVNSILSSPEAPMLEKEVPSPPRLVSSGVTEKLMPILKQFAKNELPKRATVEKKDTCVRNKTSLTDLWSKSFPGTNKILEKVKKPNMFPNWKPVGKVVAKPESPKKTQCVKQKNDQYVHQALSNLCKKRFSKLSNFPSSSKFKNNLGKPQLAYSKGQLQNKMIKFKVCDNYFPMCNAPLMSKQSPEKSVHNKICACSVALRRLSKMECIDWKSIPQVCNKHVKKGPTENIETPKGNPFPNWNPQHLARKELRDEMYPGDETQTSSSSVDSSSSSSDEDCREVEIRLLQERLQRSKIIAKRKLQKAAERESPMKDTFSKAKSFEKSEAENLSEAKSDASVHILEPPIDSLTESGQEAVSRTAKESVPEPEGKSVLEHKKGSALESEEVYASEPEEESVLEPENDSVPEPTKISEQELESEAVLESEEFVLEPEEESIPVTKEVSVCKPKLPKRRKEIFDDYLALIIKPCCVKLKRINCEDYLITSTKRYHFQPTGLESESTLSVPIPSAKVSLKKRKKRKLSRFHKPTKKLKKKEAEQELPVGQSVIFSSESSPEKLEEKQTGVPQTETDFSRKYAELLKLVQEKNKLLEDYRNKFNHQS